MIENSKTFNLASGQKLGEVLSAEVIDFQNGGKLHFVQTIQAIRSFPFIEPLKHGGVTMQLNSLDQPTLDGINYGVKVVSPARNDIVLTSSGEGTTIKTQERKHKKTWVTIEILVEDILQYLKMGRKDAASELKGKCAL